MRSMRSMRSMRGGSISYFPQLGLVVQFSSEAGYVANIITVNIPWLSLSDRDHAIGLTRVTESLPGWLTKSSYIAGVRAWPGVARAPAIHASHHDTWRQTFEKLRLQVPALSPRLRIARRPCHGDSEIILAWHRADLTRARILSNSEAIISHGVR